MRKNIYIIYKTVTLQTLALILILTGCVSESEPGGKEEFEEGVPVEVSFSISSRFNGTGMSRADGKPVYPEHDHEKINDWFIVFIDNTGKVAKILNRYDAETGIASDADAVEAETFRCILPSGTGYTAYAFANITSEQLKTATGLEFGEDQVLNSETFFGEGYSKYQEKIADAVWTSELNGLDIDNQKIPMSGHRENFDVKNTIEETFSIEVVRMVAKVQFLFTNPTDIDITVKSISLDPITTTPVSLFPNGTKTGIDYSYLGEHAYTPLPDAEYSSLSVAKNLKVEKGKTEIPSSIYIKESLSTKANGGAFTVGMTVVHGDGTQEFQQYNITKDIKGYINRNDWIKIPITLSQYDVSVEALFYPPIGGYPAVLSTIAPDGSQVFTFGTEGEFSLVPHVFDKVTGQHLDPGGYTISLGEISDEKGIFAKNPTLSTTVTSLPDEIIGTLSTNKGTATVEVNIKIGDQPYTRKIYIIRS